jgi:hypothetical protein
MGRQRDETERRNRVDRKKWETENSDIEGEIRKGDRKKIWEGRTNKRGGEVIQRETKRGDREGETKKGDRCSRQRARGSREGRRREETERWRRREEKERRRQRKKTERRDGKGRQIEETER